MVIVGMASRYAGLHHVHAYRTFTTCTGFGVSWAERDGSRMGTDPRCNDFYDKLKLEVASRMACRTWCL
jgi:hypothetical protein